MIYFILLCGGKGSRIGLDIPKQYLEINNKPIFSYSIKKFNNINNKKHLIIAAEPQYFDKFKDYIDLNSTTFTHPGKTRQETVLNALNSINKIGEKDIVLIHDSARMFVTDSLIEKLIEEIKNGNDSAIPFKNVFNAVFDEKIGKYIDRSDLKLIETPQAFNLNKLIVAYRGKKVDNFVDDGSIFYEEYKNLNFVYNKDFNLKITSEEDLEEAERRIRCK